MPGEPRGEAFHAACRNGIWKHSMRAIDLRENSDAEATATAVAADNALCTVRENIAAFGDQYPADTTKGDVYPRRPAQSGQPEGANTGWTTSFWPGMLWLAHDLTGDKEYLAAALSHVDSFAD